jgi:hypothetical protein
VLDGPVHDSSLPEQCRGVPLLKVYPLLSEAARVTSLSRLTVASLPLTRE